MTKKERSGASPPATWGVNRKGEHTDAFQPGIELHAKYTFFAEGCRGNLGQQLEKKFELRKGSDPQVYGIGLKETLGPEAGEARAGPRRPHRRLALDSDTYGGSFLYHLENNQAAVGFVVGLGYTNPYLSPYEEFQRYKTHPAIRGFLEAASASPTGRAQSQPAACNRCPSWSSPRLPGRRRCRIPQRFPHQGEPLRHQVRHAGRRSGRTRRWRRAAPAMR